MLATPAACRSGRPAMAVPPRTRVRRTASRACRSGRRRAQSMPLDAPSAAQRVRRLGLVAGPACGVAAAKAVAAGVGGVDGRGRRCGRGGSADVEPSRDPRVGPVAVITVVGSKSAYWAALPPNSRSMVCCFVPEFGAHVAGDVLERAEHVGVHHGQVDRAGPAHRPADDAPVGRAAALTP